MQGETIEGTSRQIRLLKCYSNTDDAITVSDLEAMYPLIGRQCGDFPAEGVYHQGDTCVYIDTPSITFGADTAKRACAHALSVQVEPERMWVAALEREKKRARRYLVKEIQELEGRCDPPLGPCFVYRADGLR
ncbi:hypothetical protein DL771_004266 [Monosporascus sp. 5C6A]|nr:hypothetical protein DL771_004266 [Monosporascus sp. 5C6A]